MINLELVLESANVATLSEAYIQIFQHINRIEGQKGYLSGPITADGPDNINANLGILLSKSSELSIKFGYPVLSAPNIISNKIYWRIKGKDIPASDWERFWDMLLKSNIFTDVFMLNGWERSTGARKEHQTAQELKLNICYLK